MEEIRNDWPQLSKKECKTKKNMEIVEIYKGNKIRSRKGEISPKSPKRKGKRNRIRKGK